MTARVLPIEDLRELARLMNTAKRMEVTAAGITLRFLDKRDAERAYELLKMQGRRPCRVNDVTLSVPARTAA